MGNLVKCFGETKECHVQLVSGIDAFDKVQDSKDKVSKVMLCIRQDVVAFKVVHVAAKNDVLQYFTGY